MSNSQTATKPARGADLAPEPSTYGAAYEAEEYYWVGLLPDAPMDSCTIGGVAFPKLTEQIRPSMTEVGEKVRVGQLGAITRISKRKLEHLRDCLRRSIVRYRVRKRTVEDGVELPPQGHIVTVPSQRHIDECEKQGRAVNPYVPRDGDKPAAHFIFARRCEDQRKPRCGDEYPPSLYETGL